MKRSVIEVRLVLSKIGRFGRAGRGTRLRRNEYFLWKVLIKNGILIKNQSWRILWIKKR